MLLDAQREAVGLRSLARLAAPVAGAAEAAKKARLPRFVQFKDSDGRLNFKFMSAGGDDKERSHFTARVLIITELNAFGKTGETSEESNKYEQLKARVRAFDDQAIIYQECTETVDTGLVHVHYKMGTASRLASPCTRSSRPDR